jgi:type VI secretion system protein ImpA
MSTVDDLLKPISPEKPCGDDPAYDPNFRQLDILVRGKEETMLSKSDEHAEEPNWSLIDGLCHKLFENSKHLHVAVVLSLAWLKLRGLAGFRDGLILINGLLKNYWETVYPRLDPEEGNDPTERLNILSALCAPPGVLGDPMRFVIRIRQAPLCQSRNTPVSAADIIKSENKAPDALPLQEIANSFAATPTVELEAAQQVLADILAQIHEMESILTSATEASHHRSWQELVTVVEDVRRRFTRYAPLAAGAAEESTANGEAVIMSNEPEQTGNGRGAVGTLQSRQDVVRTLDLICEYYRRYEPSSPIPLLLRRAQRLVDKDFVEIVNDLTPEALGPLKLIIGDHSGGPPPLPGKE